MGIPLHSASTHGLLAYPDSLFKRADTGSKAVSSYAVRPQGRKGTSSICVGPRPQVLMLDADSLPLMDPQQLFRDPRFVRYGR